MSIRCLLGNHHPSISAMSKRPIGYVTICERCARPLERQQNGRWAASPPMYEARGRAG